MNPDFKLSWKSSARTDVGNVREINEDAYLDAPEHGLWVVADGMGGHAAGDLASGAIIEALSAIERPATLAEFAEMVDDALVDLNARLREMASREDVHTIGSTVVVLLALGEFGICIWAGDSRLYRLRDQALEQITQDHALVEELVSKGIISAAEAAGHPQSNLVTRAIGASNDLFLDMEIFELRPGDRFVLCSDGLDKEVPPEDIAYYASKESLLNLSEVLVALAVERGARDNVTVVCVEIVHPTINSLNVTEDSHISLDAMSEPSPT